MNEIIANVGNLASFIGSLTVVGAALLWVYNKFIGEPRERRREKESSKKQKQMLEMIIKENKPLAESIDKLSGWVNESVQDRESLHKIADENVIRIGNHEERLDNHNNRLIVLETKNGITTYKEKYGEEK